MSRSFAFGLRFIKHHTKKYINKNQKFIQWGLFNTSTSGFRNLSFDWPNLFSFVLSIRGRLGPKNALKNKVFPSTVSSSYSPVFCVCTVYICKLFSISLYVLPNTVSSSYSTVFCVCTLYICKLFSIFPLCSP